MSPETTTLLRLDALHLAYPGGEEVVQGLTLELARGEIGSLLGASGCGKTTVLRAIAGFLPVRAGAIWIGSRLVGAPGVNVPPEQRRVGVVFQDYALFPHLDVAGNIAFGLRERRSAQARLRVDELLALVGLGGLGNRYPHELSGGQQQRVALARALAPRPDLLLLDEPFSNLDVEMRERLSLEVREILKQSNTTAILVTHDQHEAFAMADHIGVMRQGRLEQWQTPYALYHEPATRYVADFVGMGVFLPGTLMGKDQVQTEMGLLQLDEPRDQGRTGDAVDVLLRPDDLQHDDSSPVTARVVRRAFRGAQFLYTLALESGREVLALVPSHHDHPPGSRIGIRLEIDHVVVFDSQDAA